MIFKKKKKSLSIIDFCSTSMFKGTKRSLRREIKFIYYHNTIERERERGGSNRETKTAEKGKQQRELQKLSHYSI